MGFLLVCETVRLVDSSEMSPMWKAI